MTAAGSSGLSPQSVPPGCHKTPRAHLPPKFTHLHPLSSLEADDPMLSALPYSEPVKAHFSHFKDGENWGHLGGSVG